MTNGFMALIKEIKMEKILKSFTLDFFGAGKHKTTAGIFFERDNVFLLDVRSKEEVSAISINMGSHTHVTSVNIPITEIPDRINEIPKDQSVAIFCPANVRSSMVYGYLRSQGFTDLRIMEGGYTGLTDALKPGKIFKAIQHQ